MSAKTLSGSRIWIQVEKRFDGFGSTHVYPLWPVAVTLLATISFAYFNFKNERSVYQFNPVIFPVNAVSFLETDPQSGNMFNEFNWGGYMLYRTWPSYLVFIDSQSDFYGEDLIREYDQIMNANGDWITLLDKYQVEWAIIPPGAPLAPALGSELHWETVYEDNTAIILRKP
jgi:hypothetical protein